jgi:O-antigen ligase
MNWLPKLIKTLLWTTVLTPLVATPSVIFPYTFGKITLLRGVTFLALALTLIWWGLEMWAGRESIKNLLVKTIDFFKSKFGILFSLTAISFLVSTLFATDQFIAFWGDVERGEGVLGIFTIGIFLLLAKFWFTSADWKKFWWGVCGVGVIISVYAWLEYLGLFGITQLARTNSLVGNAGVFSTCLILLFAVLPILWREANTKIKNWLIGSGFLFLSAIFLSGTRGAFLGFGAGVVFLAIRQAIKGDNEAWFWYQSKKFWARVFLGLLIILGVIFGFTRSSAIWTKVPVLDRLATSSFFDTKDPSTATRLITWQLSWDAFKEKPIFGWGPEHFITAYERYYNPEFATYGETWIDRAHNQFLDVLVARGLVGFLLWLGLLIFLFQLFPKNRLWQAVMVAYLIQSLFIFDSFLSYWIIAAFLAFGLPKSEAKETSISKNQYFSGIFWLLGLAILIFTYFSVWLPFSQAKQYREASKNPEVEKVVGQIKSASLPYTFAQPNLRIKTIDTFYLDEFFYRDEYRKNPKFKVLGETLIENLKEIVRRHGKYDVRYSIQLVEVLNAYARENTEIYKETEKILREAIELSPGRLEIYYHLAFSLAGQERAAEAVEVARKVLAMNERAPRSHFSLGLMLAANRQDTESQTQFAKLEELDPNFGQLMVSDKKTLGMLYSAWGMYEKVADLVLRSLRNEGGFGVGILNQATYEDALRYFAAEEKAEEFLLTADYLKKIPELKEDMEILSDLVMNGNWEIIHNLK